MSTTGVFGRFFEVMGLERFARGCWTDTPVLVPGGFESPAHTFSDLLELLSREARDIKIQDRRGAGGHREFVCPSSLARPCYEAGFTVCVPRLEGFLEEGARVMSELRRWLSVPGTSHINAYVTPDDGGFAPHYDSHWVFVCQLEGAKRWTYGSSPSIPNPVANHLVSAQDSALAEEAILRPGDVLFLPPGTVHSAQAVGFSYAWSISFAQRPLKEFVWHHLAALGRQETARRASFYPMQLPSNVRMNVERVRSECRRLAELLSADAFPLSLVATRCLELGRCGGWAVFRFRASESTTFREKSGGSWLIQTSAVELELAPCLSGFVAALARGEELALEEFLKTVALTEEAENEFLQLAADLTSRGILSVRLVQHHA